MLLALSWFGTTSQTSHNNDNIITYLVLSTVLFQFMSLEDSAAKLSCFFESIKYLFCLSFMGF